VENSWLLQDGRALGTGGLIKKPERHSPPRERMRSPREVTGRPLRDESELAAERQALAQCERDRASGKAQAPHIKRRGYLQTIKTMKLRPRLQP
jgi:hypothetical protein